MWIWGPYKATANLMLFYTPEFIQGMLTIINAFHVPYTDVLMHCPLKITTRLGNRYNLFRYAEYYAIEGYPLPFLPINDHELVYGAPPANSYDVCNEILNEE